MDQNKVTALFRREWARVTKGMLSLPQPVAIEPQWGEVGYDLMITLDGGVDGLAKSLLELTGCIVVLVIDRTAHVRVPDNWVTAPTRLMFAANGQERLYNALLEVGIADWLDIRLTTDQAALEVEFIEHPTAEQIAALKRDYDVLTFDELVYTFVERTAAPLVDPAKVEAKVRQCWAGGHGGKIASIEPTTDPREWIVTTVKPVPANANLRNHGLALVKQIAPEVTHVRIIDELWSKLLQKPAPAAVTETTEAPIVADGDTQSLPELDERDLEINALKAQVDSLQHIIKSMTPLTNEWQTLTLKVKREGTGITAHPEISEQEALGWRVHHVQYAPNGEDRLFVFMERRAQTQRETARHYAAGGYVTSGSPFMRRETVVPVNGKGEWSIADAMIDTMNDELTPSMNALAAAFGVDLGAWR